MAHAETWILSDAPIPQDQVAATLDLYREEKTLGAGSTRVNEAPVTLGIQHVYAPPGVARITAAAVPAVTPTRSDYYLVTIPFTLHPLSRNRGYEQLKLEVQLTTRMAIAFKLLPDNVQTKQDIKRAYDLSAALKAKGAEIKGGGSYSVAFQNIQPLITSFGLDEPNFYWIFKAQKGHPLRLGSRTMLVLLEVPHGTRSVTGSLHYEADIDSLLSWIGLQTVKTDVYPIFWNLKRAEPPTVIPWTPQEIANPMIN